MATVKTLSAKARHRLEQRGFIDFINALNPLDTDEERILVVNVDGTTGELVITDIEGLDDLVQAIAEEGSDDITISRDAEGVLTAAAAA